MPKVLLGKSEFQDVYLDVDILLRTRLLLQASSGGGKSWLLRRLAEQLFGKIQVIIIDPEGEFSTLREKYGYVLVGKGGETPADPRSAGLVAEKLLELHASAVCDLYEMKPMDRHRWVKLFLEALIDAPKKLWHPVAVIVDEAHTFAPEKSAGESEASEAMIALATRGRKRGFAAVFATQRLGKLRKDASAELQNVLIGLTSQDIDRKRAADQLGIYGQDQHEFFDDVKMLKPGQFFALGRAISMERILMKVGEIETTHPEAGSVRHNLEPPPTPDKVKELLPRLADLPKAAEEKARTEQDLRREIQILKAQLRTAPTATKTVEVEDQRAIERAVKLEAVRWKKVYDEQYSLLKRFTSFSHEMSKLTQTLPAEPAVIDAPLHENLQEKAQELIKHGPAVYRTCWDRDAKKSPAVVAAGDVEVKGTPLKMLKALADFEALGREQVRKAVVASWCGIKHTTGTWGTYLSSLTSRGLVEVCADKNFIRLTAEGRAIAGHGDPPSSNEEMLGRCMEIIGGTPAKMLKFLWELYPSSVGYETLAAAITPPISANTGTFGTYLSTLSSSEMVVRESSRRVKCAEWLFID